MTEEISVKKQSKQIGLSDLLCALGCREIDVGIYRHEDFAFDFDFSATADDKIIQRFYQIFAKKGYETCQENIRDQLGIL